MTRPQAFAAVLLAVVLGYLVYNSRDIVTAGRNDFAPFYVAAQLAGKQPLYQQSAYREFLIEQFSGINETLVYIRPPFHAALLWPLGLLPYETAHAVWIFLRLAAVAGFVLLWRLPSRTATMWATALCLPIAGTLVSGQDTPFLLLILALAWRWFESGRYTLAGLALSLCAIKFHLFLTLPLWLLSRTGRPLWKGFAAGAGMLTLVSFAVGGWSWPVNYLAQLRSPAISPFQAQMPNLRGLFVGLQGAVYLEAVAAILVGWACWKAAKAPEPAYGFAAVLLGGLLVSRHAYTSDCVILLPVFLILRAFDDRRLLRTFSLLMILPAPLLAPRPGPYLIQVALVVIFFAIALAPSISTRPSAAAP